MIRVGLLAAGLLLVGCGNDPSNGDPLHLSGGHKNEFNTDGNIYYTGYSCIDTGSSNLAEMTNQGSWPTLTFSFRPINSAHKDRLPSNATKEDRCNEINVSMLNGPKVEFSFQGIEKKDQTMAEAGALVPLKLHWATLKYQDGTRNEHSVQIKLRCEGDFNASCIGSKCEKYTVHAPNEVCTFRESGTLFELSNHRKTVIDLTGEIDFRAETNPVFKITSLAVVVET